MWKMALDQNLFFNHKFMHWNVNIYNRRVENKLLNRIRNLYLLREDKIHKNRTDSLFSNEKCNNAKTITCSDVVVKMSLYCWPAKNAL